MELGITDCRMFDDNGVARQSLGSVGTSREHRVSEESGRVHVHPHRVAEGNLC